VIWPLAAFHKLPRSLNEDILLEGTDAVEADADAVDVEDREVVLTESCLSFAIGGTGAVL
jgi:hypothetical protein